MTSEQKPEIAASVLKESIQQELPLDKEKIELLATLYAGPLPPPSLLAKFEEIQPGLVERIVLMAERQAAHRQSMELKQFEEAVADQKAARMEARFGQVLGFLICVFALIGGTYASINGSQFFATVIGGGGVVALAAVFIHGKRVENTKRQTSPVVASTKQSGD
ncbi:hypothetical protein RAS2_25000 [Phycisphaerae bacterium RAS2]|nr:hypothetical protein RAS2_25000 [Phycisphaerae bacterium RAS2]